MIGSFEKASTRHTRCNNKINRLVVKEAFRGATNCYTDSIIYAISAIAAGSHDYYQLVY